MADPDELSDAARAFASEYLVDFKVSTAAARAGISAGSGANYLKDPRVQTLIQDGKRRAADRANISADWVLEKLRRIAEGSPLDYFTMDDDGKLTGISLAKLTDEQRDALKAIKFTKYGPSIEMHSKTEAVKLVGQYFGMFVERHELTGLNGKPLEITPKMTPQEAAEAYQATLTGGTNNA